MRATVIIKEKDLEAENVWCEQNIQHGAHDFFSAKLSGNGGKRYYMSLEMTKDIAKKLIDHYGNRLRMDKKPKELLDELGLIKN